MKSIRKKITVCLMATVLTALLLVGATSITLNYRSTIATVDQMMRETAVLAAERVEQELTAYKNVAMDTGCIPQLSDATVSLADKRAIIDERVSMHGFQRGNILAADGRSIFDGNDYSDREYVKQAMAGNVYVSEPLAIMDRWSARSPENCPSWWRRPSTAAGAAAPLLWAWSTSCPRRPFSTILSPLFRSARTVGPT